MKIRSGAKILIFNRLNNPARRSAKGNINNSFKMKLTKFSKGIITLMFAGMFFIPTKADAKMFGKECTSVTTDNGSCSVTMTTYKQRFLWINVGTSTTMSDMEC